MNTPDTNDIDRLEDAKKLMEWERYDDPTLLEYLRYYKNGIIGEIHIEAAIAQETNKAVVVELEELNSHITNEQIHGFINNRIKELTADKEQVPDASIVADKPENYKAGVIGKVEGVELYSINGDSNIMTGQEFYDRFKDEVRQTVHKAQSKDTMYLEQDEVYEAAKRAAGLDEQ